MKSIKALFLKYPQSWTLLYIFIYFPWFFLVEQKVTIATGFTDIHTAIDDMIPFCEYFIIPYLIWFVYTIASVLYFLFRRPKEEYYRLTSLMFIGMTIALIIYTVFPNGQSMRPPIYPNKNICSYLVMLIYKSDTCTNVFPSLHVFVSLAVNLGWWNSEISQKKKWIKPVSAVTAISICLSTVFLKQHSILDGMAALIMVIVLYILIYQHEWTKSTVVAVERKAKNMVRKKSISGHNNWF